MAFAMQTEREGRIYNISELGVYVQITDEAGREVGVRSRHP